VVLVATLKKNYLIKKRNILNEIRANNMTLQELRFFSVYLSKIDSSRPETRIVRFPLDEFRAMMELGRLDIKYMKNVTNSLLSKVVNVPIEHANGRISGYTGFQLFKECTVSIDNHKECYVEIDAHDKALPLMFEFKSRYFSYQLFNALRLKSTNQLRMYELLKQYERIGERIYTIENLKKDLWLNIKEYPRFGDFKNRVLDACQQALTKHTDIKFTYEPHGKRGKGGKILSLKFIIEKNKDYIDQLTFDMFIEEKTEEQRRLENGRDNEDIDDGILNRKKIFQERIELFVTACRDEFSFNDMVTVNDKLREYLSENELGDNIYCYHYINDRYNEMLRQAEKRAIPNRFSYVKSLFGKDI
jgi:plasmid replication initiation protein